MNRKNQIRQKELVDASEMAILVKNKYTPPNCIYDVLEDKGQQLPECFEIVARGSHEEMQSLKSWLDFGS